MTCYDEFTHRRTCDHERDQARCWGQDRQVIDHDESFGPMEFMLDPDDGQTAGRLAFEYVHSDPGIDLSAYYCSSLIDAWLTVAADKFERLRAQAAR